MRHPHAAVTIAWVCLAAGVRLHAQNTDNLPVVYRVAGMEAVRVEENRVYKRAEDASLTMDVAQPAERVGGRRAVIVFLHGGPLGRNPAPATGWAQFRSFIRLAAAQGFVGVSVNFRYYDMTREGLTRAASDVADAVRHVQAHSEEWNADPRRVCIWTFSGGGPMLALVSQGAVTGVRCLVSYYAVLDAGAGNEDFSLAALRGVDRYAMPPVFIARAASTRRASTGRLTPFSPARFPPASS